MLAQRFGCFVVTQASAFEMAVGYPVDSCATAKRSTLTGPNIPIGMGNWMEMRNKQYRRLQLSIQDKWEMKWRKEKNLLTKKLGSLVWKQHSSIRAAALELLQNRYAPVQQTRGWGGQNIVCLFSLWVFHLNCWFKYPESRKTHHSILSASSSMSELMCSLHFEYGMIGPKYFINVHGAALVHPAVNNMNL